MSNLSNQKLQINNGMKNELCIMNLLTALRAVFSLWIWQYTVLTTAKNKHQELQKRQIIINLSEFGFSKIHKI